MRTLIVAATEKEINQTINCFSNHQSVNFLITGVGMCLTSYKLSKQIILNGPYDLIINAGIAGAFNKTINIGDVTAVKNDCFAEMGAENDEEFILFPEMNLPGEYAFENKNHFNSNAYNQLRKVKGVTMNKVHGNEESITKFLTYHQADIESMEGAAVAMVCELENIPYLQLRSISNYVTKRNTTEWNIPLAIKNLNEVLISILNEIGIDE